MTLALKWAKVKYKYANRKPICNLLFHGNSNIALSVIVCEINYLLTSQVCSVPVLIFEKKVTVTSYNVTDYERLITSFYVVQQ